ncbi:MAG: hypothetical protein GW778_08970 [Alphaproteobacteria bacterium]|nr:hypothetical protein [Alphaproteobacteria bacterium]
MALGQAFNNVATQPALPLALQDFINEAGAILSPHDKLEIFSNNMYIRAMMDGSDDMAIAGINVNLSGRQERGLSNSVRRTNQLLTTMMMNDIQDTMDRLADIQAEREELREAREAMLRNDLTQEEFNGLPPEDSPEYQAYIRKIYQEKLEAGDISQDQYDAMMKNLDRDRELQGQENEIIQELVDNGQIVAAYRVAKQRNDDLLDERRQIESRLNRYDGISRQIMEMRSKSPDEVHPALDLLLTQNPDLDIEIPADLEPNEALDYVQAEISEAAAIDSGKAVEIEADIAVASESLGVVSEYVSDDVKAQENKYLGENQIADVNAFSSKNEFSFSFEG